MYLNFSFFIFDTKIRLHRLLAAKDGIEVTPCTPTRFHATNVQKEMEPEPILMLENVWELCSRTNMTQVSSNNLTAHECLIRVSFLVVRAAPIQASK